MKELAPSVASEALKSMLAERSLKTTLADAVGVGPYQISRWLGGRDRPMPSERAKVEDILGISWRLWDDEDTKASRIADAVRDATTAKPGGLTWLREKAKEEPAKKASA